MVKGALWPLSAAPPTSLEAWEAGEAANGVTGSRAGSSFLHMPRCKQREETTENNCTNHRVFKKHRTAVAVILEDVRFLGLREIPALDADVCPDVFPLM